jgi:hypothetical protein
MSTVPTNWSLGPWSMSGPCFSIWQVLCGHLNRRCTRLGMNFSAGGGGTALLVHPSRVVVVDEATRELLLEIPFDSHRPGEIGDWSAVDGLADEIGERMAKIRPELWGPAAVR